MLFSYPLVCLGLWSLTGPDACSSGAVVAYRKDRPRGQRVLERICLAVERTCWIRPGNRIRVMAAKGLGGHGHDRVRG